MAFEPGTCDDGECTVYGTLCRPHAHDRREHEHTPTGAPRWCALTSSTRCIRGTRGTRGARCTCSSRCTRCTPAPWSCGLCTGEENVSKQAKTASNLSGATVVSVGLLIWNEKDDAEGGSITWITKKDFKEAVQAAGGKVGATVNKGTTIVVKGNTTRNDGYETPLKAVTEQQQVGSRKAGALKVESLGSFLKEYPDLKAALQRRLSSAYWPKTISVYDKHAPGCDPFGKPRDKPGAMVDKPNKSYKSSFERTEKVLQAALMQQGRAMAAEEY
eukprot:scaffold130177_cov66-Phaeocystis_antarctica.AAC.1